ncbi:L,D-transpeptidase family protein [Ferruginibacter sp. SUN106]|uniref:L,D-transpeptidase family protein n=1 Tax=Ferruginibacter sp. SUN106 TaxID=2978348 RepID=UPI003D360D8F
MKHLFVKTIFFILPFFFIGGTAFSQNSFVDIQKSSVKLSGIFSGMEDSLIKQFDEKKLTWPPQAMYIRSFKYDRQLEVWVKGNAKEPFKLFKTYKICMQSGTMGPKRMEGDYQVPEGFYYINEFNPNSNYHLALGLNYPNASDKILSDSVHPGNAIYIHGNCVSTGCIPISDEPIEELYIIATHVKSSGQDFIPVHVFPVKYNVKKSAEYLAQTLQTRPALIDFATKLKEAFNFFEEKKQLPVILVNKKGEYVVD